MAGQIKGLGSVDKTYDGKLFNELRFHLFFPS